MLSRIAIRQVRTEVGCRDGAEGRCGERPLTKFPRSGYLNKRGAHIKAGLLGPTDGLRREKPIGIGQGQRDGGDSARWTVRDKHRVKG